MYKPLQQQLQRDPRESPYDDFMSPWGNPQLQPMAVAKEQTYTMPMPKWAPGEFNEWKQAHMLGIPTRYGLNAQRAYNSRMIPNQQRQIDNAQMNPALLGLMRGRK